MKLTLDHTQRLNLHALLGAQRADVGSIRAIWAVQDKIALDAEEAKTLGIKREVTNGLERVVWNPTIPRVRIDRRGSIPSQSGTRDLGFVRRWWGPPLARTPCRRPVLCGHSRAVDSEIGGIGPDPIAT
jgi:hypothetical protein